MRTATSVIIRSCEVTIPLLKAAPACPFPSAQSYTLVKVGVPLLVDSFTLSYLVFGLPIIISHTSALVTG